MEVVSPSLTLVFTLIVALAVLIKLRSDLSDAASTRISDIGKTSQHLNAEQFIAIARAQAGLPCTDRIDQPRS